MKLTYIVKENDNFDNIKQLLRNKFNISERLFLRLKRNKKIYLNSQIVDNRSNIYYNDKLEVLLDFEEENDNIVSVPMDLNIIYEDDGFLVLNKPSGIPTHPSLLHYDHSISNGVKYYFDTIGLKKKIRPVNRLDKDTSGIIIFAKNEYIQECLIRQMNQHIIIKEYTGIVEGILKDKVGTISAPISRKENSIIERCISPNGDIAITHYEVINEYKNYSLVKFLLETGRTHQIRVHSAYIGHPILGDTLYGNNSQLISRQALHSYKTQFIHPINKRKVEYSAELPEDMKSLLY